MDSFRARRARMVERDIAARGVTDPRVLEAFREVPREDFIEAALAEFAYEDAPLPIGGGQTISQPYIVAVTLAALELPPDARVLEIGTGSGYAAALLSRIARDVYTVERVGSLASAARERLARLGYHNVRVMHGDGTLGWAAHAPYDGIAVAAGGPRVPTTLLEQLTIGGKLVMPVGAEEDGQKLLQVTRTGPASWQEKDLGDVCFVPLIGAQGWAEDVRRPFREVSRGDALATLVREVAEPIEDVDRADVSGLLERIGDARVVLLGEATHGTSEFYRLRARITKELVARRNFRFLAVEADWPDAAYVDDYVLGRPPQTRGPRADVTGRHPVQDEPFSRFPTWMWRNEEVATLAQWLRSYNAEHGTKVGFHGLDLYSMFTSIAVVLAYLDDVDPDAGKIARHRYGTLTPWQRDPSAYGRAVLLGRYESSENAVVAMLREMLARRFDYALRDGERFFDAAQNARVVASAEKYYRAMYYANADSWNLRDTHMFETLRALMTFYGDGAKAVVWAHNTHVGDARATEFTARGERDLGELCRQAFGDGAYIVGFGTDHGTVLAARAWDEPGETMRVLPSRAKSYERIFHDSGIPALLMHLRNPRRAELRDELAAERVERAIGVVYQPRTEPASHYFRACLPRQFDEYAWLDETTAVRPLARGGGGAALEGSPFA